MNHRLLATTLLTCAPLASGCFLQPLDPEATRGGAVAGGELTTATKTPPIEFAGGVAPDSCTVTTTQATAVLEKYCAKCHSGRDEASRRGQPPFDFLLNIDRLKAQGSSVADLRDPSRMMKFVAPGDPDNSRIYFRVSRGEMPPKDPPGSSPNLRPTVSDISILREWIGSCMGAVQAGPILAPASSPPPPATPGSAPGAPPPGPGTAPPADPNPPTPPGGAGAQPVNMVLTSPTLEEGEVMPLLHSVPMNRSPELSWTGEPRNTLTFAVTLTTVETSDVLWAIWDIPASVTTLPANIPRNTATPAEPRGSKQRNIQNGMAQANGTGYLGPATNAMAARRTYRFDVWALDVRTLPLGARADALDTTEIADLIQSNAIAGTVGSLTVKGNPGN
jgi:phosphatidylethanolamine-binding protein (PEBP) family uncharacterized protein